MLVTDGLLSFVMFLYEEIEWTKGDRSKPAVVGVHAEDGHQFENVSESLTPAIMNINTTSNVGIPGVWIFLVNGEMRTAPRGV